MKMMLFGKRTRVLDLWAKSESHSLCHSIILWSDGVGGIVLVLVRWVVDGGEKMLDFRS
jgi:hypothetical protein